MNVLLGYELNVGEVVQVVEMGQSRVSRHLKILAESGLVECRRDGLWAFYRASREGAGHAFLAGLGALFEGEAVFEADRVRAERVVRERTTQTRNFFDSIVSDWERLSREVFGDLDLASEIVKRVPECRVAAELGCGPGDLLGPLAKRAEKVIGVDNSSKMLELAGDRYIGDPAISLRIGELAHLPLRDWEADCAILSMVLHHLTSPQQALNEAQRVLKAGGKLIVAEFDRHTNELMRKEYGDRLLGIGRDTMEAALEQSRFSVTKVTELPVNMGLNVLVYEASKR